MGSCNLDRLEKTIINHGMMATWGDGLWTTTEAERSKRAQDYKDDAIRKFQQIMNSSKNDGSAGYEMWAINKTLGLSDRSMTGTMKTKARYRR